MEENISFLKYIYQDDLFIIDEIKESNANAAVKSDEPEQTTETTPSKVEESKPVTFFGRNANRLLILVNEPDNDYLNQRDFDFLMKIMESGLNYSKNDFSLVNLAKWPIKQVLEEIPYDYLLLFGEDKSIPTGSTTLYQISEKDGKKILLADALGSIEADVTKKKLLWSALKSMFKF